MRKSQGKNLKTNVEKIEINFKYMNYVIYPKGCVILHVLIMLNFAHNTLNKNQKWT